jgi:tetratricopeptide (TPR) repeat protein
MTNINPFGTLPPETLVIRLYSDNKPDKHRDFQKQFLSILPYLNWRSHIYIVNDDPAGQIDGALKIIGTIAEYFAGQKLSTIYIHPFITMHGADKSQVKEWGKLLKLMLPFQKEAYDQQNEVRILLLPIIEPLKGASVEEILFAVEFFRTRLAKPRLYFHEKSCLDTEIIHKKDLRAYIDPSSETSAKGITSQLWINHVFDDIQKRVQEDQAELIAPCSRHLILDEKHDAMFTCFTQWKNAKPAESLGQLEKQPEDVDCHTCISNSCLSMEPNLLANTEGEERSQVFLGLGMALSKKNMHKDALPHTRAAFKLSTNDENRAIALLHQGLCHMSLMELSKADEILKKGRAYSTDPGLFSYHRGNVRFAGQTYVKAINLFKEALEAKSPEVPEKDLLFNLAVSYVNMEEFSRARHYLDLVEQVSSPILYYQGVCDFAEGLVESAIERFREALALGPAPEDLSRILFYIGTCLKELGQYDEAIIELEKAIAADPHDYMNYNLLGFCFFQVKKHEKAIEAFQKAIGINPDSAIDHASIGSNLRELGRLEEAIAMYTKALSLDPALSFAKENITKIEDILKQRSIETEILNKKHRF